MNHNASMEIFDLMDLPFGGLALTKTEIIHWGLTLIAHFLYQETPEHEQQSFSIEFSGCKEITWTVLLDETDQDDLLSEVLGFHFKAEDDLPVAIIVSLHTELYVIYRNLTIHKDW